MKSLTIQLHKIFDTSKPTSSATNYERLRFSQIGVSNEEDKLTNDGLSDNITSKQTWRESKKSKPVRYRYVDTPQLSPEDFQEQEFPIFATTGFQLKHHQIQGYNWLLKNLFSGRNSLLADEMGLSKSIVSYSDNQLTCPSNL